MRFAILDFLKEEEEEEKEKEIRPTKRTSKNGNEISTNSTTISMTKKEHHKVNELDNPPRRQRHIHGVDILTHETKKKLKEESKF